MRIDTIAIDGFGQFHGAQLSPAPGLTVIRGPNEAGKTTLLAFTRAMLFGFETHKYPALNGGKRGGWLDVGMADGRELRIERYGERGGSGKLRVIEDDKDLGPGHLAILLQGVESTVYRNIFAFGLGELTRFETLRDDEVAARIYGAGLGTGGISGLKVEQTLGERMEDWFKTGGSKPRINALLRRLEEVDHELGGRDLPGEYAEAGRELDRTLELLRELGERYADLDAEHRRWQRVIDGWQTWLELRRAQEARERLGDVHTFEDDILERLSGLETSLAESERAVEAAARERERAQAKLDEVSLDEAALEHRAGLEAAVEATRIEAARVDERDRAGRALAEAEQAVEAALANLGGEWTIERVEGFDDSIAVKSAISGHFRTMLATSQSAVEGARGSHRSAEEQLEDANARAEVAGARVAALKDELARRPSSAAQERNLREIERLTGQLPEQRRIAADVPDQDLATSRMALDEHRSQARELAAALVSRDAAREMLPSAMAMDQATTVEAQRQFLLPSAVAIGSVVLGIVLALLDVSITVAVIVAAAGVVGGIAWAVVLQRRRVTDAADTKVKLEGQLDEAQATIGRLGEMLGLGTDPGTADVDRYLDHLDEERRVLEKDEDRAERAAAAALEVERLNAALAAIAGEYGLPDEPSSADIDGFSASIVRDRRAEAQLAEAAERERQLEAEVEARVKRVAELAAALEQRTEEAEAARSGWAGWLEDRGLDVALDPETAVRIVDSVTAAKQSVTALRAAEGAKAELLDELARYERQVRELASALGERVADGDDVPAIATLLAKRLGVAVAGVRERDELAGALEDREGALEASEAARATAKAEADALVAEASVEDGAALRSEVARAREAVELDAEISATRATLTTLSGPGKALEAFEADLRGVEDVTSVEARASEIAGQLGDLDDDRDRLNQEAGRLRASRAEMEQDVAATELRQEREDLLSRLQAAAERWTVYALAHQILKRSRSVYEEAHRPAVVEKAEHFFSDWTDGRYRRIIAPLGEDIRGIERRDGIEVSIPGLSRGTSEQLYLALRFGLVQHFVETSGEPLPIVMDDILVNFDADRAARAARSIEELASTCQIIYFTCHESTPLEADVEKPLPRIEVN
jgi:uncharacterized protein YhaN